MNDPTNWDAETPEGIECKDNATAKEIARRWNAYPGLIACLRTIAKPALGGKQQQYMAQQALRHLGEPL